MAERTDAHIMLRLIYQAMLNARLPAEAVLASEQGVALAALGRALGADPQCGAGPVLAGGRGSVPRPACWFASGRASCRCIEGQVLEYLFTSSPYFW
jgi:hypothetical protein